MPGMRKKVLRYLDREEPDYEAAASALGPEALPELSRLVAEADVLTASKATHLASLIESPAANGVVEAAAGHPDPVVRVAAAAAVRNLTRQAGGLEAARVADAPGGALDRLLQDTDPGVRKFALKSAADLGLEHRVEAARTDPEEFLRRMARERRRHRP